MKNYLYTTLTLVFLGLALRMASAQSSATWNGNSSSDFTTAGNWTPNDVPNSNAYTATFTDTANSTTPNLSQTDTVNALIFTGSTTSYTFTDSASTDTLVIDINKASGGAYAVNLTGSNSSATQTFDGAVEIEDSASTAYQNATLGFAGANSGITFGVGSLLYIYNNFYLQGLNTTGTGVLSIDGALQVGGSGTASASNFLNLTSTVTLNFDPTSQTYAGADNTLRVSTNGAIINLQTGLTVSGGLVIGSTGASGGAAYLNTSGMSNGSLVTLNNTTAATGAKTFTFGSNASSFGTTTQTGTVLINTVSGNTSTDQFDVQNLNTMTISGNIVGSNIITVAADAAPVTSVNKIGNGTLVISGTADNYEANVNVNNGTLKVANNTDLGTSTPTFYNNQTAGGSQGLTISPAGTATTGTLDLNGTSLNRVMTLNGTATAGDSASLINSNTSTAATVGGGIAGVTFHGTGTGSATLPTGVAINSALTFSSGSASAVVNYIADASSLSYSGGTGWQTGNTITLTGGGSSASAVYTVTASSGSITALTLSSTGTGYTSFGTITAVGAKGTATVTFAGSGGYTLNNTFDVQSVTTTSEGTGYTSTTAPTVTNSVGGTGITTSATVASLTLTGTNNNIGGAGNITINAPIISTGGFTKIGAGTVTLNGSDTYSGGTSIIAGTLQSANATGLGSTSGALAISGGGTLDIEDIGQTVGALTLGTGGSTIQSTGGTATLTTTGVTVSGSSNTIASSASVTGSFTQNANSRLTVNGGAGADGLASGATLAGTGTVGVVTLTGGTDTLTSAGTLTTSGITVGSTSNVISSGTVNGTITQNASSDLTVNGAAGNDNLASGATLEGAGSLGLVSLAGTNTLSSASTLTTTGISVSGTGNSINSGIVSGGSGGTTLYGSGTVGLGVAGTLSGSGGVTIGNGTNNATLTLNTGGSISGPVTVNNGSVLAVAGTTSNSIGGSLTIGGGGTVNLQNGAVNTLDPTTLTLNGNGTLDLDLGSAGTDALTFSGANSFNGYHLAINVNALSGATTGTYTFLSGFTGGTLALSDFTVGGLTTTSDTALNGDTLTIGIGSGGNSAYYVIAGVSNNYYFTGSNSGSFTDPGNYFTAASGGTQQSTALSSTSSVYLNAASPTATNTPDTLNGTQEINSLTFVTGGPAGSLAGTGTLGLVAGIADSATGGTTESVAPTVALYGAQTWTVSTASNTLAISGPIVDGAGTTNTLTLIGPGTFNFSNGSSTYAGGTSLTSGTLLITNSSGTSALGTGPLSVAAGATFGGAGNASGLTSFAIGSGSGTRAQVIVGSGGSDTTTALTLSATGASTITTANLTFNLNTATNVGSTAGNELNLGATPVTFTNTTLTLNLVGTNIITPDTAYVLITDSAGFSSSGLTFGSNGQITSGLSIANNTFFGTQSNGYTTGFYNGSYLFLADGGTEIDVEVVPEPSTWAMMVCGLSLLLIYQRIRKKSGLTGV